MEAFGQNFRLHPVRILNRKTLNHCPLYLSPLNHQIPRQSHRVSVSGIRVISFRASSSSSLTAVTEDEKLPAKALEQPGGKMVVELVGAFNELWERMNMLSTSSSRILFKTLKLSIPILFTFPLSLDGRSPLSKALSVAVILADLQKWRHYLQGGPFIIKQINAA